MHYAFSKYGGYPCDHAFNFILPSISVWLRQPHKSSAVTWNPAHWISDISTGEMAGRSFGWQTLKHDGRRKNINVQNSLPPISTQVFVYGDLREPKRKAKEAWTVEIVETGYLSEGHIACLMPICKVCFIFWGVAVETEASVWENTLSWENPWNVECGMFVREYFWPNPLCRNQSNTSLGPLPKGLVLLKALRKVLRGSLRAAYTLWFPRTCAFGMF